MCAHDNDFTRPWMEWLFAKTFSYPQPVSGIQDYMIRGTGRGGRSPIGSYSYMIGEPRRRPRGLPPQCEKCTAQV